MITTPSLIETLTLVEYLIQRGIELITIYNLDTYTYYTVEELKLL